MLTNLLFSLLTSLLSAYVIIRGYSCPFVAKENNTQPCVFLLKSTEYLNFSHFSHFAILVISLGNLMVPQKDLAA